ncbi:MAG: hypothetical protein WBQ23_04510 [Bacteroidota bacterium]
MATLTIKNIPDDLYLLLKETAKRERRSINSEAIVRLELSLHFIPMNDGLVLEQIRRLREEFPGRLTERERLAAVAEGRA